MTIIGLTIFGQLLFTGELSMILVRFGDLLVSNENLTDHSFFPLSAWERSKKNEPIMAKAPQITIIIHGITRNPILNPRTR